MPKFIGFFFIRLRKIALFTPNFVLHSKTLATVLVLKRIHTVLSEWNKTFTFPPSINGRWCKPLSFNYLSQLIHCGRGQKEKGKVNERRRYQNIVVNLFDSSSLRMLTGRCTLAITRLEILMRNFYTMFKGNPLLVPARYLPENNMLAGQ